MCHVRITRACATASQLHAHAPQRLTWVHILKREGGTDHGGKEATPAHFEIYGAGGVSLAAPFSVGGHNELVDEGAHALAIDAVRVFVIRAVEARVPGQVVALR